MVWCIILAWVGLWLFRCSVDLNFTSLADPTEGQGSATIMLMNANLLLWMMSTRSSRSVLLLMFYSTPNSEMDHCTSANGNGHILRRTLKRLRSSRACLIYECYQLSFLVSPFILFCENACLHKQDSVVRMCFDLND